MIRPRDGRIRVASENQALVQGGYCLAAGLILRAIAARKRSRMGRLAGGALVGIGGAALLRAVRRRGSRKTRPLASIASGFVTGLDAVQLLNRRSRWRILGAFAELALASAWLRRAARSASAPLLEEKPEVEATPAEEILDHALEETFPASDPVIITPPERREPPPQL